MQKKLYSLNHIPSVLACTDAVTDDTHRALTAAVYPTSDEHIFLAELLYIFVHSCGEAL